MDGANVARCEQELRQLIAELPEKGWDAAKWGAYYAAWQKWTGLGDAHHKAHRKAHGFIFHARAPPPGFLQEIQKELKEEIKKASVPLKVPKVLEKRKRSGGGGGSGGGVQPLATDVVEGARGFRRTFRAQEYQPQPRRMEQCKPCECKGPARCTCPHPTQAKYGHCDIIFGLMQSFRRHCVSRTDRSGVLILLETFGFLDDDGANALSAHAMYMEPAFRAFLVENKVDVLALMSAKPSNDRTVERAAHKAAFLEAISVGLSGLNTSFAALAVLLNHPSSFRLALNDKWRNLKSDVFVILLALFDVPGGKFTQGALEKLRATWKEKRDEWLEVEENARVAEAVAKMARHEAQFKQQRALRQEAQDQAVLEQHAATQRAEQSQSND
jgi:hypothetical protein